MSMCTIKPDPGSLWVNWQMAKPLLIISFIKTSGSEIKKSSKRHGIFSQNWSFEINTMHFMV